MTMICRISDEICNNPWDECYKCREMDCICEEQELQKADEYHDEDYDKFYGDRND